MASYRLLITNPSESENKLNGEVVFRTSGPNKIAIGTISGLPIPFTTTNTDTYGGKTSQQIVSSGIISLEGNPSYTLTEQQLVDEIILNLSTAISQIYGFNLSNRLTSEIVMDKPKQEESTPVPTGTQSGVDKQTSAIVDPKSINTKITLSVKSGPGVIIGITEKEVVNGEIDFSGLQFDQPGDYVIAVTPTSNDVEGTEFSITIAPEEEIIAQDDSRGEEGKKPEGDRPIIAQINKPEVELKPIEFIDIVIKDYNYFTQQH